jgi:hypothetical protein
MSSPPLWLTLQPRLNFTQILLSESGTGTLLKARLAAEPMHPGALSRFLQSLAEWQGRELFAVIDADAGPLQLAPDRWARMLGEANEHPSITVEWSAVPAGRLARQRFFEFGDFNSARRLLVHAATGQQR